MWALGQAPWQRAGRAKHRVFCLLLLMEKRQDGIFFALDVRCARKAWSLLFATGIDGDGDKPLWT
jgi:hypothetical protein